jgi:hypothetical protein
MSSFEFSDTTPPILGFRYETCNDGIAVIRLRGIPESKRAR